MASAPLALLAPSLTVTSYPALLTLPHILLLLQLITFDDEMDVAEVDHFTYYCDVYT